MVKNYNPVLQKDRPLTKVLLWFLLIIAVNIISLFSVYRSSRILFVIISFSFIVLLSYLFWKKAILIFLIWVTVSGAVRKWLLHDFSDVVFLFNHILLAGIYIRYSVEQLKNRSPLFIKHPLNIFLSVFFLWGLACAFNPMLPNFYVGLLGLIVHYYFIPLIAIVPCVFNTKDELIKVLKIYASFSLPLLILGLVQFFSPVYSPINAYILTDSGGLPSGAGIFGGIATVGGHARITSTFSFISGYTTYLNFLAVILVYLLEQKGSSIRFTVLLYLLLVLNIINFFMTGSRGPTGFCIFGIMLYVFFSGMVTLSTFKKFFLRFFFAALLVFSFIAFTSIGQEIIHAFTSRATGHEDLIPRIIRNYTAPFDFFKTAGLYGFGIGTTYQGSVALGYNRLLLMKITGGFEDEPGRLVIELGLVGFIIIFITRFILLAYFFSLYKKLKDESLKHLALAGLVFQLPYAIGINNLVFDYTSQIFYWFAAGLLFLLPKLDQQILEHRKA